MLLSARTKLASECEAQRALVEKKFEILRQASFGFTQDRLLHIQEEDLKRWTDACTGELRRKIASAAPSHIKIALIDFRPLRCGLISVGQPRVTQSPDPRGAALMAGSSDVLAGMPMVLLPSGDS